MTKNCTIATMVLSCFMIVAAGMTSAHAEWALNNESSRLSFASIKADDIGEVHHFGALVGSISKSGEMALSIDLKDFETWIDIRNERMKAYLFEVVKFPVATVHAQLDLDEFSALAIGEVASADVEMTLDLHGQSRKMDVALKVIRLAADRVMVIPDELIMVNADDFALTAGIQKLRELAQLPNIASAVPVSFYLTFENNDK